jgi:hypothetical protein
MDRTVAGEVVEDLALALGERHDVVPAMGVNERQ